MSFTETKALISESKFVIKRKGSPTMAHPLLMPMLTPLKNEISVL